MKISPLVLFAYNRPFHTIKTIESVKRNKLSKNTDLIVYVDGPKKSFEDEVKVSLVRNIIKEVKGFKSKRFYFRKKNIGLSKNLTSGISKTFEKYDRLIILEDDILVSNQFLDYMNKGLSYYEK